MTGILHRPNYIALDTSHVAQWIRESSSSHKDERAAAHDFARWLENSGSLALLTHHHIAELCTHEDTKIVAQRLRFLHGHNLLAWVTEAGAQWSIGGVATILTAEINAAYRNPEADIHAVRLEAMNGLIAVGTGYDLLGTDPHDWLALVPAFVEQSVRAQKIVALTHANIITPSKLTLGELMSGQRKSPDRLAATMDLMRGTLAQGIKKKR